MRPEDNKGTAQQHSKAAAHCKRSKASAAQSHSAIATRQRAARGAEEQRRSITAHCTAPVGLVLLNRVRAEVPLRPENDPLDSPSLRQLPDQPAREALDLQTVRLHQPREELVVARVPRRGRGGSGRVQEPLFESFDHGVGAEVLGGLEEAADVGLRCVRGWVGVVGCWGECGRKREGEERSEGRKSR